VYLNGIQSGYFLNLFELLVLKVRNKQKWWFKLGRTQNEEIKDLLKKPLRGQIKWQHFIEIYI